MTAGEQPYPVVAFDLDGTLLRGTSVTRLLARQLGNAQEIDGLERAFAAGEISNRAIADASAASYVGRTSDEIASVLGSGPWIDGIDDTVRLLRRAGTQVLLATITWRLAAEILQARHGFTAVCGTEVDVSRGVISRYFDEHDKLRFVEWCAARHIPMSDVAAVGDSRSDVPLFGRVGRAVALNATPDARSAATHAIDTGDLRDVLPLLTR